ncbi:MAG: hypothetical protein IT337_03255 [Thermomicrobiales bacterium]|nr:hypothetical protein [Thermomicrobiales bacterium]
MDDSNAERIPLISPSMETDRTRARSRWIWWTAGAVLAALVGVAFLGNAAGWWSGARDEGMVFVIPAGARAEVARPTIDSAIAVPTDIRFAAGEPAVITIHNRDDVAHRAGPFVVGPGQTLTQRFPEPGRYPIACSVDPLESVVVTVEG